MPTILNCKGASPQIPYRPKYWQCWGLGLLPETFWFRRFGVEQIPGAEGFCVPPFSNEYSGTLTRVGCEYKWMWTDGTDGLIFYPQGGSQSSLGRPPWGSQIDQPTLLPVSGNTNALYGPSWFLSGVANTPIEAYCSKNATTGVVDFYFLTAFTNVPCRGYIEIRAQAP